LLTVSHDPSDDIDWDAEAIEALEAARKMPPGKEKSDALKKAGTLRNIAHRRGIPLPDSADRQSKAASVGGLFRSIVVSRRAIRSCQTDYDPTFPLVNKVKDICRSLQPFKTSGCRPVRFRLRQFSE
jgi:hypothetical protein